MQDPELAFTQDEIDIFGDNKQNDDIPIAGPPTSFGDRTAEKLVIIPNVEEANLLVLKPCFKSRKRKDLSSKFFDAKEHEAFSEADAKQCQHHWDLGAAEIVSPEKKNDIPKEKILPIASRFVRNDKNKNVKIKKLIVASRLMIYTHLEETPSQEDDRDRTDASIIL